MRVGALVLAAGAGERMGGGGKALVTVAGVPFLELVIRAAREGGCEAIWVVLRPGDEESAEAARSLGSRPIWNPKPDRGMFSSVQTGCAAALEEDPALEGLLVHPVDHPRVHARTVTELVDAFASRPTGTFVRPRFQGRAGHPILLDRPGAKALTYLDPGMVFRTALRRAGLAPHSIDVGDAHIRENLNLPEDLPDRDL